MMPRPAGTCPPWPMDPRGQQLPLPGNPTRRHPLPCPSLLPAALSPPALPPSLHPSFTCSLWPSFCSFSHFLLFPIFSAFFFRSSMSVFFLFSCFLHFPIFLLFLFLSSFPFFLTLFLSNSFSAPFYFPIFFSFPFFHLFPFVSLFPFPSLSLSSLFSVPRAQAGGPSHSRRGQCQRGCGSRGAPGAPGVGGPGLILPSCLLGASTAQPHSRGQK